MVVLGSLDLPPGDVETVRVHNDLDHPVVVFDCADDACVPGFHEGLVPGGEVAEFNENVYQPGPLGIADPGSHRLLGCMVDLPHAEHVGDDYPADNNVRISSAQRCPGSGEVAPVVRFFDPSGCLFLPDDPLDLPECAAPSAS